MRIIPKKTKVKVEFYRNFTLADILIGLLGLGIEFLILFTDYGMLTYIFYDNSSWHIYLPLSSYIG